MSFGARWAGARPVEGDVLWKTGVPHPTRTPSFPQDLQNAPQPPTRVSHTSHRPDDDELYLLDFEAERSCGATPRLPYDNAQV